MSSLTTKLGVELFEASQTAQKVANKRSPQEVILTLDTRYHSGQDDIAM